MDSTPAWIEVYAAVFIAISIKKIIMNKKWFIIAIPGQSSKHFMTVGMIEIIQINASTT